MSYKIITMILIISILTISCSATNFATQKEIIVNSIIIAQKTALK